jgi:hypothetical protein
VIESGVSNGKLHQFVTLYIYNYLVSPFAAPFEAITSNIVFSSVSAGILSFRKWRRYRKLKNNFFSEPYF